MLQADRPREGSSVTLLGRKKKDFEKFSELIVVLYQRSCSNNLHPQAVGDLPRTGRTRVSQWQRLDKECLHPQLRAQCESRQADKEPGRVLPHPFVLVRFHHSLMEWNFFFFVSVTLAAHPSVPHSSSPLPTRRNKDAAASEREIKTNGTNVPPPPRPARHHACSSIYDKVTERNPSPPEAFHISPPFQRRLGSSTQRE